MVAAVRTGERRRAFEALTAGGQVRRLRRVAAAAVARYELGPVRIVPLNHGENTTFRVNAARGAFMLRVCRPGYQSAAALESELDWLEALRRDTALRVPRPLCDAQGVRVQHVAAVAGVPQGRSCVLFEWIPGVRRRKRTPAQLRRVGRVMAELHAHALGWTPPATFARPRLDGAGQLGARCPVGRVDEVAQDLEPRVYARLCEARARLEARIDALGMPAGHSGLIHADLHGGNILFDGPVTAVIDFDDCAFGHHLADLAVALTGIHESAQHVQALLAGYREVRALPDALLVDLPAFVMARELMMVAWFYARSDNPDIARLRPRIVERAQARLDAYEAGTLIQGC